MAKTAKETEKNQAPAGDASPADSKKQAQSAEFPEAVGTEAAAEGHLNPVQGAALAGGKLDIILDMNVPVTVSIGRTEMPVRRLLQLGPGSVLKLDKPIDAPADLLLKDAKFAAGNVVVVDGRFAVRIKQIIGGTAPSADHTGAASEANEA